MRKSNRPKTPGLDREDLSVDRLDFSLQISNIFIKLFLARLGYDARIWISIVIFDREGRPNMRLRRRPFQIREPLHSISQELFLYFLTVVSTRQNVRNRTRLLKFFRNYWQQNQDAELFAIDNILNQDDYQSAITHASSSGLKIGNSTVTYHQDSIPSDHNGSSLPVKRLHSYSKIFRNISVSG